MTLTEYLKGLQGDIPGKEQQAWFERLRENVSCGEGIFNQSEPKKQQLLLDEFRNWSRTEELKAWYSEPENDSLFQGTSISSLTIPYSLSEPLQLTGVEQLEDVLAESYIMLHDRHEQAVRNANLEKENVEPWIAEGLYYGVAVSSKIIAQSFGLSVMQDEVIFPVEGELVDPHEILSYAPEIRASYFDVCSERIGCFRDLDITQTELEESLVLADISKPKIKKYYNRLLLGPVRSNEIAALLSRHVTVLIREKTNGRISPRSLMVTIYDSDTPYTYHKVNGSYGEPLVPVLPGLTILGASGTIDSFRWLYAYRVSLIAQKIMKSSLFSEVSRSFIPFVFFGVLVKRDADILLDLDRLSLLRYRGQLSARLEFCYLLPKIEEFVSKSRLRPLGEELDSRT